MSTSHQPAPPRPLAEVLSYRDDLTDALTGGPITGRTQLTALHQPDPSTSEGQLVRNLAGVARPAQPCYIVGRGARFPPAPPPKPTRENPPPSYGLTFTCNRLVCSPSRFFAHMRSGHGRLLTTSLADCTGSATRVLHLQAPVDCCSRLSLYAWRWTGYQELRYVPRCGAL